MPDYDAEAYPFPDIDSQRRHELAGRRPADQPSPKNRLAGRFMLGLRALLRSNELALVVAASLVGLVAALCVTAMTQCAIAMHVLIFNLPFRRAAERRRPRLPLGRLRRPVARWP